MADIVRILGNKYIAHHFRAVESKLPYEVRYADNYDPWPIIEERPSLVVCFDEHWCELGNAIGVLKDAGIPTLQVMDGILEWRRTWDYTRDGQPIDGVVNPLNQPAFADVIGCLGTKDARILNSWGNQGKCEMIGVPRFDHLVKAYSQQKKSPGEEAPFRLLIMTAKTPGFTEKQVETTIRSLKDLKECLQNDFSQIEVVWRLTKNIEEMVGVQTKITDLTGQDLHSVLGRIDAVITTPSTAMLESMLFNIPVALLDYHNCPHYFEAAWSISSGDQISTIVDQLMQPPATRMDYQRYLLQEQLQIEESATDRLAHLIKQIVDHYKQHGNLKNRPLLYPLMHSSAKLLHGEYQAYYPQLSYVDELDVQELRTRLSAALGTNKVLYKKNQNLQRNLDRIPGYKAFKSIRKKLRGG